MRANEATGEQVLLMMMTEQHSEQWTEGKT